MLSMFEAEWFGRELGLAPASVPPWMSSEMLLTEAAVERARAWLAAGSPVPSADDLVRKLRFIGDPELRSVVLVALHEKVPPPAASFLLDRALFIGTGWSAHGHMTWATLPAGPFAVIQLDGMSRDGADALALALHEMAHAWLIEEPPAPWRPEQIHNEMGAGMLAAAEDEAELLDVARCRSRNEAQANSLARSWGASQGFSLDAAARARDEAAHLVATYGRS